MKAQNQQPQSSTANQQSAQNATTMQSQPTMQLTIGHYTLGKSNYFFICGYLI